jgi:two-component system sensor histidine kinase YesM
MSRRKQFLIISVLVIGAITAIRTTLSIRVRNSFVENSNQEFAKQELLLTQYLAKLLEVGLKGPEDLEGFGKIRDQILKDFHPTKDGYFAVIDSQGKIVFHPRQEFIGLFIKGEEMKRRIEKDPNLEKMINRAMMGQSGTERYTFEDVDRIGAFSPAQIGKAKWSVFIVTPVSTLRDMQKIHKSVLQLDVVMSIMIMLLLLGLNVFIDRIIFRPLKSITHSISEISRGNLAVVLDSSLTQKKDEIGALAQAFERTLVSLKLAMKMVTGQSETEFQNRIKTLEEKLGEAKRRVDD